MGNPEETRGLLLVPFILAIALLLPLPVFCRVLCGPRSVIQSMALIEVVLRVIPTISVISVEVGFRGQKHNATSFLRVLHFAYFYFKL